MKTFEDWLRQTQKIKPAELGPDELAEWHAAYREARDQRCLAEIQHNNGLRRQPGDTAWGVAVRDEGLAWHVLGLRKSKAGEYFVGVPSWIPGHDPHSSYHQSGHFHDKSHGQISWRQVWDKPSQPFRGCKQLWYGNISADHATAYKIECHPAEYSGVFEIPIEDLEAGQFEITVDLVEPGADAFLAGRCVHQKRFKDGDRDVVMTLWQQKPGD